jgi:hypothetical protein
LSLAFQVLAFIFGLFPSKWLPLFEKHSRINIYDCLNYFVVDAHIEPLAMDERMLAKLHLDSLAEIKTEKELIISDRGYPSEEMIDYYEKHGFFYLMRVRSKFNLDVDNQQGNDGFIEIGRNKVRVIKVVLDTGEIETLLTNLVEAFDFKALYLYVLNNPW